ncbi:MAG: hypothetical protein ACTSRI_00370 [Promethearchaeota archaeon]
MAENKSLSLIHLFDSIGIIEKGIEKIYHYLLKYNRIDNLKDISKQYDLSLKRGYKICSVLNDLGLVQIFDRPMKILLSSPVVPIWQKLINERIENLRIQFIEKERKCESAFEEFMKNYSLDEEISPEPVEFINFEGINLENIYYPLFTSEICKFAVGIKYNTPIKSLINKIPNGKIPNVEIDSFKRDMRRIKENLTKIKVYLIINNELMMELINGNEFKIMAKHLKTYNFEFKELNIRITEENLSNFCLTSTEFIQPCFAPSNLLIGLFVSRDDNIREIFNNKFKEFFDNGIPINDYLKSQKLLRKEPLSEAESFTLCLL